MRKFVQNENLWIFSHLPESAVCIDLETTGFDDCYGPPDIIAFGISVIRNAKVVSTIEFKTKPTRPIEDQATQVHGISNEMASTFEPFELQWSKIKQHLSGELLIAHNSSYDWGIINEHISRYGLNSPTIKGVFCTQKAATPWALANGLRCSERGVSLDALVSALNVDDLRKESFHGAGIDSAMTAACAYKLQHIAQDLLEDSDVFRTDI